MNMSGDRTILTRGTFYSHDWASTPLGSPDLWSAELKLWTRLMLDSQSAVFIAWGADQLLLFNEASAVLLGAGSMESLGGKASDLWPPESGRAADVLAELRTGRSGVLKANPILTRHSGFTQARHYNLSFAPLVDLEGRLCGSMAWVEDCTFDAMMGDVRQERDRLRQLFELSPSFVAILEGPDHRYVLSNTANNRILGRDDVVGRTVRELFPELVAQGAGDILDRVYRTGEPYVGKEVPFPVGSGETLSTYRIDLVYQPMRNADGEIVGIFAEGYDVTERCAARDRIRSLQTELIHLSRVSAMDTMGSALAHELNQPLTSVANYVAAAQRLVARGAGAGLADDDRGTNGDVQAKGGLLECLASAASEARRAGDIIRKLREMTVRGRTAKTRVDLCTTLSEAATFALAGISRVSVAYDLQSVEAVRADTIQLQQVLINLIRNSCDAVPEGPLHLLISARRTGKWVEICVADDGPGIDPEILPDMFESFTSSKAGGMGIGLSICRTIIESHGGNISARNNTGGGATLCFTLPAEVSD